MPLLTYNSISALTAAAGSAGDIAFVNDPERTSGNPFTWEATGTINNGTIYNAGGSGVWRMMYEGPLNVKWFGAVGDAVTDDTAAFQAAIDTGAAGLLLHMPLKVPVRLAC